MFVRLCVFVGVCMCVIAGLLSGLSVEQALEQGSICGALVASMFGDWTGIPTGKLGLVDKEIIAKVRGK